tara:strand:+ start:31510 stop:31986 length:477 start_codon:yes stop_codon:yes gene_type:complete
MSVAQITIENLRQPNFEPHEFIDSVTARAKGIDNAPNVNQLTAGIVLTKKMQELRDALNHPIHISSGFRCDALNKAVGGAPNSRHTQFLACDFGINNMTPTEIVLAIRESGISVDKCFVERNCVHLQTSLHESDNRNEFGNAKLVGGRWIVTNKIEAV